MCIQLLSDRIEKAGENLDEALERIRALVEPIVPPKNTLQYQQYFCAVEQGNAEQLKAKGIDDFQLTYALDTLRRTAPNAMARRN